MNVALRRTLTVSEYLARGATQSERQRSELINGQIVAMSPERAEHIEAKFAVALALKSAISRAGLPCHALADGATVQIAAQSDSRQPGSSAPGRGPASGLCRAR
jgi:Uma2 family endonuclease